MHTKSRFISAAIASSSNDLALHHVAPVAGGIADRKEDRLRLGARALSSLVAPGVPVHRVVRVLQEVRALLEDQPIRVARFAVHALDTDA